MDVRVIVAAADKGWFYDYQTFFAGLLALLAAGLAAWIAAGQLSAAKEQVQATREQIQIGQDAERRRLSGQRRAARAMLTAALDTVCDYATRLAHELMRIHGPVIEFGGQPPNFPGFPREAIPILERNLEFLDEGEVTNRIESILREAQVLDARVRSLISERRSDPGMVRSGLIQCASIYARAESLFGFARKEREGVDPDPLWDRVFAAFLFFRMLGQQYDDVREAAQRSRDRGDSPGEADRGQE